MQLIKMSWRNIWRNKVRSAAVMVAVMLGLVAGLFSSAMVEGVLLSRFHNFIENQISHIQVHNPEFIRDQEVFQTVGGGQIDLETVANWSEVKAATIRSRTQSMIASATYTGGVELYGIRPNSENNTTNFSRHLIEGDYLIGESENAILIGNALAEKMKVRVGSRIVLTFHDKDNNLVSAAFVVRGLFDSGYKRYDESVAFTFHDYLNSHLGLQGDFHEMAVLANNLDDLSSLEEKLSSHFPKSEVRKWNEIEPGLEIIVTSGNMFSYIFLILIMIGLAFGLLNTMLMAVFERTREIGMLMAIGMGKGRLFLLIVLETLFLSLTGSIIGLLLGYGLVKYTGRVGIDLSAFSDVMKELGVDPVFYPEISREFALIIPIIVLITALLSAIYPALKALSLRPVEALQK
ncbi:MAG: ABC transporter permease [Cryomorphaceae bacterium]|nr:ABC transporter permease [Cryomorphaceae bacterium]